MSVNQRITPPKGNAEFKSFVGRILRAHGRRVADADPEVGQFLRGASTVR